MSLSGGTSIMVALPDIDDSSIRSAARDRFGIAPGEIVIVAAGRAHRLSGHRFVVWAVSTLKMAEIPVRLIIQDTGRYARNVAEFAEMTGFSERLILAGAEWSVSDLMVAADIALLDSDELATAAIPAGLTIVPLVRPYRPRQIARALLEVIEDKPTVTVNDK